MNYKIPVSVLVVIHTPDNQILMLERADHPGWWQSVTGSQNPGETLMQTAIREVQEETGLDALDHALRDVGYKNNYEIYECYRHRYAPGTTHNTEHVFYLELPSTVPVRLSPQEHLNQLWLPAGKAAEKCFSPSNAEAILKLVSGRFAG
jgi:dATP pyrophosphohydrolase